MASDVRRDKRLILLEFNELCPGLVDKFIGEGLLPNFKRLRDASQNFITHATDEVLEPWIQWVTVHTGVPLSEHGILDLDEADKLRHQTFWEALPKDNVLLMSPMNVKFRHDGRSVFMPDPWAASQTASDEVKPFYKFIRSAVNSHARTDKFDLSDAFGAFRFLISHGLRAETMAGAAKQLWEERSGSGDVKWRRATILDRMLWDVFAHFWKSARQPRVGIFFSNATAHYQHKYWSHHDPDSFGLKPDAADIRTYGNAIRFGYQAHDRLIGKAMSLAGSDTAIALCTALSQQPMLDYESRGGKAMFIPKDYRTLLSLLGAPAGRSEVLMAEESWLHFDSEAAAQDALAKVSAARTGDGQVMFKTRNFNGRSFIIGCAVFVGEVKPETRMVAAGGRSALFLEHFLKMGTVTSAKHHPDGLLWVADPQARPTGSVERLPLPMVRGKLEQALAFGS